MPEIASEPVRPNFLIVGAQKCGTTWLHSKLGEHPQIHMSVEKEIHFFDRPKNLRRGMTYYEKFFREAKGQAVVGESTPNYFWTSPEFPRWLDLQQTQTRFMSEIPGCIAESLGKELKILVVLRNPVERSISAMYHHLKFPGRIDPDLPFFANAKKFGIVHMGFYAAHLQNYLNVFRPEQIKTLLYEDLFDAPIEQLRDIYRFLGVSVDDVPANVAERIHAAPGRRTDDEGNHLWRGSNDTRPRVIVTVEDRRKLGEIFRAENDRLGTISGLNVARWNE